MILQYSTIMYAGWKKKNDGASSARACPRAACARDTQCAQGCATRTSCESALPMCTSRCTRALLLSQCPVHCLGDKNVNSAGDKVPHHQHAHTSHDARACSCDMNRAAARVTRHTQRANLDCWRNNAWCCKAPSQMLHMT